MGCILVVLAGGIGVVIGCGIWIGVVYMGRINEGVCSVCCDVIQGMVVYVVYLYGVNVVKWNVERY